MTKIALYIRVSTEEQAMQGFSIDHQRDRLIAYCASQGWEDYRFYIDDGYTGTKLDRPAMTRLIKHTLEGKIDLVVVYKLDRLSRRQKDVLHLLEDVFEKNNVAFKSSTEPFDTATPLGKATIGILAVFAQLERDMIIERTTSGRRMRIRQGRWSGGRVAFGYRWDKQNQTLVIVPEKAELIRKINQMYLQGKSRLELADWLNARSTDIKVDHNGIKSILDRVIYTGRLPNGPSEPVEGQHEAIIPLDLYTMVQNETARRRNGLTSTGAYLLSGLCRCGLCGSSVIRVRTKRQTHTYEYYACKNQHVRKRDRKGQEHCQLGYFPQEKLEAWIIAKVRSTAIDMEDLRTEIELSTEEQRQSCVVLSAIEEKLTQIDHRLNRWYDAFEEGFIQPSHLKERIDALEAEKRALWLQRDTLEEAAPEPARKEDLFNLMRLIDQSWDDLDFDARQAVLRAAIKTILLRPNQDLEINWNV
ncbi:hypothetical protein B2M26_12590 [Ferroacidibacillus organovorans]|uniref:Resolvase n=2 Tax=Ferroacidibacillus organovorans TaxID=1765683 RepID=A0A1V4EQU6_9BACL|nr:hypothetical protein B2M26_12590 [Ferroacidibacillus organovorans]